VDNLTIFNIDLEQRWYGKGFSFDVELGYEKGLRILGADKDKSDLPKGGMHRQFDKIGADIRYHRCLCGALSFDSWVSAQYAWVGLPATEQLALTDFLSGVRGCSDLD
jgi:hemolysin activation/secretion protein